VAVDHEPNRQLGSIPRSSTTNEVVLNFLQQHYNEAMDTETRNGRELSAAHAMYTVINDLDDEVAAALQKDYLTHRAELDRGAAPWKDPTP